NVNNFFNQLEYCSARKTWNKSAYWASRLEFIGKGQGDCEDFAVAKFLTMIQLGVPGEKIFLTYVRARGFAEPAHLVATYYKKPGSVPFVLDNYIKKILPATQRPDLVPVYSFTARDLYIQKQHGLGKRLSRGLLKTQRKLKAIDLEIREKKH
ncbi:MAG: transglutaminase-like cysteine peptidase, partial [Desulfobacterales bacterium]|nr:transglutaminase-like cysteine peptidase [Desulfobacterales bacterium]